MTPNRRSKQDPRCQMHPHRLSIGTTAGKRGVRRHVCEECAATAAVLGGDFTFQPLVTMDGGESVA